MIQGVCSFALFLGAFFICAASSTAPAAATVEYCPASVGDASTFPGRPGLVGFSVRAFGERSVSGTITAQTDKGWFVFPFSAAQVSKHRDSYTFRDVSFDRNDFYSQPLFVQFPAPVAIQAWWVSQAAATGDGAFGWSAKGVVDCRPTSAATGPSRKHVAGLLSPVYREIIAAPPAQMPIVVAVPVAAPFTWQGARPFSMAKATSVSQPDYPTGTDARAGLTEVKVAISATGVLDDAWVVVPSGSSRFDRSALHAARRSQYVAGTAFCKPEPGYYIFTAQFRAR